MKRFVLGAAVIAGTLASAASAIELTIYPGIGIGKVRLGMTKAQVQRALGRDHFVNDQQGAYTELAWDFATWTVGFQRGRAVQISTSLTSQRTSKRVGPGTTWRALMRAYPGGRCAWNLLQTASGAPRNYWAEYLLGQRGGSQTVYIFKHPVGADVQPLTISEVIVRTTFRPLPEFGPKWIYQCGGDWRHADAPELRFANP
jgi:hypothetical protein